MLNKPYSGRIVITAIQPLLQPPALFNSTKTQIPCILVFLFYIHRATTWEELLHSPSNLFVMRLVFPLLCTLFLSFSQAPHPGDRFINPTGTYLLKIPGGNHRATGRSGEIKVLLLNKDSVAVDFVLSIGEPDYQTGRFTDTLPYKSNRALYRPFPDATCTIAISFQEFSAETSQWLKDVNSDCGLGKGIMISALFEKYSSEPPFFNKTSSSTK